MALTEDQEALVDVVEWRIDHVTAEGQTPAFNHDAIYAEMKDATRWLINQAPKRLVAFLTEDGSSLTPVERDSSLVIPLPATYLRFLSIKMNTWLVPATDLVEPTSNLYRLQANPYSRADTHGPVAAWIDYPSGPANIAIETFPKGDPAAAFEFSYVKYLAPEAIEALSIDGATKLVDALLWETTARLLRSVRRTDEAAEAAQHGILAMNPHGQHGMKGEDVAVEPQHVRQTA